MADHLLASRLSCADSSFPKLSHDAALTVIADLGLSAVDICVFDVSQNRPEAVRRDPIAAAEKVAERLTRHGLQVADVFLILAVSSFEDHAINHPDAAVRGESIAYFEQTVEFAHAIEAPGLTILPGMEFADRTSSLSLAATELQRRAEIAGEHGLSLSIEPHVESIIETPEATMELLAMAPDVTVALDYSHFIYQGIAQEAADALLPRARHIHLRQASTGRVQAPTHEGEIDFPKLLGVLDEEGYSGFLCLEYQWEPWLGSNRIDCISESAELRDLLLTGNGTEHRMGE